MPSIVDALHDRTSLGGLPVFHDLTSWGAWLTFLRATYGLPLTPAEVPVFCQHTGRSTYAPPPGGWPEVLAITGRQSGKSRVAALIASYEAATAPRQADGTEVYALLVAQDHRGAMRTLGRYAVAPFELVPALRRLVPAAAPLRGLLRRITQREDAVTLTNGLVIASYPCRPAAVRGLRAQVAVCDELAFFRSSEGNPIDTEMLRALRPALATTRGKLIVLSSPHGQSGALWELHRQHYGRDDATTLVWQASAPDMNPTLPADYLARMEQDDPEAYRAEVLGEFRAGLAACFDPDAVRACVAPDRRELPPVPGCVYSAFVDLAGGGSGRDSATLAIAHRVERAGQTVAVLDCVREIRPPHSPATVVREFVDVLRAYHLTTVTGDRYAGEWPREAFRAHGITYLVSVHTKSDLYRELVPLVNSGAVELLEV